MGHTAGLVDTQKAFIYGLIDKDLSICLDEIQDEWCTRFLQTAPVPSKSTICRVLKAKGCRGKYFNLNTGLLSATRYSAGHIAT